MAQFLLSVRSVVAAAQAAGADTCLQDIDLARRKRGISFRQNDGGRSRRRCMTFRAPVLRQQQAGRGGEVWLRMRAGSVSHGFMAASDK